MKTLSLLTMKTLFLPTMKTVFIDNENFVIIDNENFVFIDNANFVFIDNENFVSIDNEYFVTSFIKVCEVAMKLFKILNVLTKILTLKTDAATATSHNWRLRMHLEQGSYGTIASMYVSPTSLRLVLSTVRYILPLSLCIPVLIPLVV